MSVPARSSPAGNEPRKLRSDESAPGSGARIETKGASLATK